MPVWEMSDGSWMDIVDDSVDWVTSFEQGNTMLDPSLTLPLSMYEYPYMYRDFVYYYTMTVQSSAV